MLRMILFFFFISIPAWAGSGLDLPLSQHEKLKSLHSLSANLTPDEFYKLLSDSELTKELQSTLLPVKENDYQNSRIALIHRAAAASKLEENADSDLKQKNNLSARDFLDELLEISSEKSFFERKDEFELRFAKTLHTPYGLEIALEMDRFYKDIDPKHSLEIFELAYQWADEITTIHPNSSSNPAKKFLERLMELEEEFYPPPLDWVTRLMDKTPPTADSAFEAIFLIYGRKKLGEKRASEQPIDNSCAVPVLKLEEDLECQMPESWILNALSPIKDLKFSKPLSLSNAYSHGEEISFLVQDESKKNLYLVRLNRQDGSLLGAVKIAGKTDALWNQPTKSRFPYSLRRVKERIFLPTESAAFELDSSGKPIEVQTGRMPTSSVVKAERCEFPFLKETNDAEDTARTPQSDNSENGKENLSDGTSFTKKDQTKGSKKDVVLDPSAVPETPDEKARREKLLENLKTAQEKMNNINPKDGFNEMQKIMKELAGEMRYPEAVSDLRNVNSRIHDEMIQAVGVSAASGLLNEDQTGENSNEIKNYLLEIINDNSLPVSMRAQALFTLSANGNPDAPDLILRFLSNPSSDLFLTAIQCLSFIGPDHSFGNGLTSGRVVIDLLKNPNTPTPTLHTAAMTARSFLYNRYQMGPNTNFITALKEAVRNGTTTLKKTLLNILNEEAFAIPIFEVIRDTSSSPLKEQAAEILDAMVNAFEKSTSE